MKRFFAAVAGSILLAGMVSISCVGQDNDSPSSSKPAEQETQASPSIQEEHTLPLPEKQAPATTDAEAQPVKPVHQQPKRILGIMP